MAKARRGQDGTPTKKGKKMQTGTGQDPSEGTGPHMDSRIQHEIGKHLRAHYIDIVNEPVPDKFMELLKKLEQSVTRKR
jgi:Anti-sigma factor NepR